MRASQGQQWRDAVELRVAMSKVLMVVVVVKCDNSDRVNA